MVITVLFHKGNTIFFGKKSMKTRVTRLAFPFTLERYMQNEHPLEIVSFDEFHSNNLLSEAEMCKH